MKGLFILIICFYGINCRAQNDNEVLLHIPKAGQSINEFIPVGYDTITTSYGDLNKDGVPDVVMALKDVREDTAELGSEIRNKNRLLIILFKVSDGWQLKGCFRNVILCLDCGGMHGDPLGGINAGNGIVTIENDRGSSDRMATTLKFRYQNNGFYLIGITDSYFNVNSFIDKPREVAGTSIDIDLVTGVKIESDVCDSCKAKKKKSKITKMPLIKMADYKYE